MTLQLPREPLPTPIETLALDRRTFRDFEALLGAARGCDGCWCYNHHISAGAPNVIGDPARAAKGALVGVGRAHGVLAYERGEPAGWCAVDRRDDIPGHDVVLATPCAPGDAATWAIHCFFVRPESRGRGLVRRLLDHAERIVIENGGRRIEAYPRSAGIPRGDLDFAGSLEIFVERGYRPCAGSVGPFVAVAKDVGASDRPA